MMESSNLDHHHHQQDLHGIGTSSLPPLPFHEVENHHKSNQTLIYNNGDFIPSTNGAMVQDLGFQWANTAPSYMNQETMPQIKEEFLDSSNNNDLQAGSMPFFGGNFSLVLPNTNFNSDMNPLPSSFPFSMAMDLRSLDILASCKFARSFYHPSMNSVMFFNEDTLHELGHHQHQHQQQQQQEAHDHQGLSNGHHHKMKTLAHGVPEEKRANTICQSTSTSKKHRPDLRSSFNHFKVRKEKLGDRIAALQQLVAPFGKTDTASVLMEAIGYIKFLQDQVETLSVPYMRSSGNKKLRTIPGEEKEEHKTDLRSRGLCLMPLSCTSYVTDENGGLWSSPNFTGGT